MSKMPNIYISTCKSKKGANMHAKNGSQQVWIQLYNFLVIYHQWHTSIGLRLQVFVASLQQIPWLSHYMSYTGSAHSILWGAV